MSATWAGLSAQGQDPGLHGPSDDEVEHVAAGFESGRELGGECERLLVLARLDELVERAGDEPLGHLGEPAGLGEGDPRLQDLQGCAGPFDRPEHGREVVVQERDLAALPGLGGERDRLPEVVEPTPVAELARARPR